MANNKCTGIIGFIFGHKFEAIYNIEKEYKSGDELQQIIREAEKFNLTNVLNSIDVNLDLLKKIKKTYVKHICKRCGHSQINLEK